MATTTLPGPGINEIYSQIQDMIKKYEPERKEAKEAGIGALQRAVDLFEPGGAMEGIYNKRKKLAMGKSMQGLVSSGLSGTTLPSGISKAWDSGPGVELLMAQMQGLGGALGNMAGFQAETSPTAGNMSYLATGGMSPFLSGQYGLVGQALSGQQGSVASGGSGGGVGGGGYSTGSTSGGGGGGYTPIGGGSGLDALNQRYGSITGGGDSTGGSGSTGAGAVGTNLISDEDWSQIQSGAKANLAGQDISGSEESVSDALRRINTYAEWKAYAGAGAGPENEWRAVKNRVGGITTAGFKVGSGTY